MNALQQARRLLDNMPAHWETRTIPATTMFRRGDVYVPLTLKGKLPLVLDAEHVAMCELWFVDLPEIEPLLTAIGQPFETPRNYIFGPYDYAVEVGPEAGKWTVPGRVRLADKWEVISYLAARGLYPEPARRAERRMVGPAWVPGQYYRYEGGLFVAGRDEHGIYKVEVK